MLISFKNIYSKSNLAGSSGLIFLFLQCYLFVSYCSYSSNLFISITSQCQDLTAQVRSGYKYRHNLTGKVERNIGDLFPNSPILFFDTHWNKFKSPSFHFLSHWVISNSDLWILVKPGHIQSLILDPIYLQIHR